MSQPQDPRQAPLHDDELAVARVLRALPAGEPSAKVDAAILAAATDAVAGADGPAPARAPPRRAVKTARWLPTWAIGTAAAAVLAIGVGTQLQPPRAPRLPDASTPAPVALPEADTRMDVDLIEPQRRQPTPTYPPPEAPGEPQAGRALAPPPPPPPVPEPMPAPPTAETASPFPQVAADAVAPASADSTGLDTVEVTGSRLKRGEGLGESDRLRLSAAERNAADAERRDAARRVEQLRRQTGADAAAKAEAALAREESEAAAADIAPASAPPAPTSGSAAASRVVGGAAAPAPAQPPDAFGEVGATTGARAEGFNGNDAGAAGLVLPGNILGETTAQAEPLPPVAFDVQLAPADWIERIRERLRRGERDDALVSLGLLRRDHPTLALPADLADLR